MVDNTSPGAVSPARFQTMAKAIASTSRDITFQVCQWGIGTNIADWYAASLLSPWSYISNWLSKP